MKWTLLAALGIVLAVSSALAAEGIDRQPVAHGDKVWMATHEVIRPRTSIPQLEMPLTLYQPPTVEGESLISESDSFKELWSKRERLKRMRDFSSLIKMERAQAGLNLLRPWLTDPLQQKRQFFEWMGMWHTGEDDMFMHFSDYYLNTGQFISCYATDYDQTVRELILTYNDWKEFYETRHGLSLEGLTEMDFIEVILKDMSMAKRWID